MFPTSVAASYARGLAGAVPRGADCKTALAALAAEYGELMTLLRESPELASALANPALPTLRKEELLEEVLASAGASPLLRGFVGLVVQRGHVKGLEAIGRELERELTLAAGVVEADIRVARPIDEAETARIVQALSHALGREVTARVRLDPELVGGFVARAGDLVFDGSLARQMERLRNELVRSS